MSSPSYYKRLQVVISFGEEDLYHFVDSQNMKNSLFIKKLIREEMLRQAGKGAVLPSIPVAAQQNDKESPKQEVKQNKKEPEQATATPVQQEEKKPQPVKVGGGFVF